MASSPVWKVRRVNYQAVPINLGDEIITVEGDSSGRCSNSSVESLLKPALTNGRQQQEKSQREHNVSNNYREVWSQRRRGADVEKIIPSTADTVCDNRITINVSGMRFETYESTLARLPDSLLGSPLKRAPYYDPINNEFYFDRNRNVFDSILFYYQSGGLTGGVLEKPDGIAEGTFLTEVKFYELGRDSERRLSFDAAEEGKSELSHSYDDIVSADVSRCETCSTKIRNLFETSKTTDPLLIWATSSLEDNSNKPPGTDAVVGVCGDKPGIILIRDILL
ncbi:potassium channel [Desmophyllum pertusum]|uniref:Potassium channel n=1 Tax=Desmophyllum pertusum TaxID=174260 RepID=A0A9W9YNJ6_9CNID|nr:potassium channel [Desmophyllum pertusum]